MRVQRTEGTFGHPDPIVAGPSGNDRIELGDHHIGVGPTEGQHLGGQPFADPSHGVVARFGQQLAAEAANGEAQEVDTLVEIRDLGLVSLKTSPLGASHSESRALTCMACSRE
jgi:hypothetical protein